MTPSQVLKDAQEHRLTEIRDVLLQARDAPDYNIGSPRALDHLLVHVVALIDALIDGKSPTPSPQESAIRAAEER